MVKNILKQPLKNRNSPLGVIKLKLKFDKCGRDDLVQKRLLGAFRGPKLAYSE